MRSPNSGALGGCTLREKLRALAELQKVDLEMAALRKASEGYPRQLADLEKELANARNAVEAERVRLADIERQRRELEQNIASEKDKVKKWEARLAEQRSPREYAALAREIDIARKSNQTLSEELIELGKSMTIQREAVKVKERELASRQEAIAGRMDELRQNMAGTQAKAQSLGQGRSELAARCDDTLLRKYDHVKKKRMPALVSVRAGICQGCNMNVPPQLYNTLRVTLGSDICPTCHRLIFASEALESPPTEISSENDS